MPRARNSFVRGVVGASIALSMAAVDVGPALATDTGTGVPATDTSVRYQVRKGDSLTAIARRNGVTVSALAAANHLTNLRLIVVGQWLVIPGTVATGAAPPAAAPVVGAVLVPSATPAAAPAGSPLVYVLRAGDSLNAVARRYKVTVAAIVAANGIRNPNRVPVGLKLTIPGQSAPTPKSVPPLDPVAPTTTVAPIVAAVTPVASTTDVTLTAPSTSATTTGTATTVTATTVTATTVTVPAAAIAAAPSLTADQLARLPAALLSFPDRLALMPLFDLWAAEYGVAPSLLKALAWMESGWQANVVSPSGAIGIGQLLPGTAAFVANTLIGMPLDPYVASDNIRMSARYLAQLLNLTNGDVNMALAGYYQGLTSVRRDGMKATTAAYVNVVLTLQGRF
jgi:LysM repeat protein